MSRSERAAEQTRIRQRLLANGYVPLANRDKRCLLPGWPGLAVDAALIESWSDQFRWEATGVRVAGRLVVVDMDIDDNDVLDAIWSEVSADVRAVMDAAPLRFGGGAKVALFMRLGAGEQVFGRMVSQAWAPPGSDVAQRVEVFGAGAPRQFGVYGVRSFADDGAVATEYAWSDDRGLCDVALDALPSVTVDQLKAICDTASHVMRAKGWTYEVATLSGMVDGRPVFDLDEGMLFETEKHGDVDLAGLEALCEGEGEGGDGVRLSASWLEGHVAVNKTRCIARLNAGDGRVQVWESAACTLHRPVDMDVGTKITALGERLKGVGADGASAGGGGGGADRLARLLAAVPVEKRLFGGPVDEGGTGDAGDGDPRPFLDISAGGLTEATLAVADMLAGTDHMFNMGDRLVSTASGGVVEMTEPRLALELGAMVRCIKTERAGKKEIIVAADPSAGLVKQVLSYVPEAGLRGLRGIVDMPILRRDGARVVAGYDAESQLVVSDSSGAGDVQEMDVYEALKVVWAPFAEFPYVGALDRAGALACVLTAIARPWLPTAPLFAFDAPVQGSGKSLLCRAVGAICGSYVLAAPLPLKNEDEIRKRMLSMLMSAPRAVIWDNQVGVLDSAALAAVLTSEAYSDRELGKSRVLNLPTGVLLMINGNNVAVGGDMPRRTVRVRIDPQMETPFDRQFTFDPERVVRDGRARVVAAGLTLLRWGMARAAAGRIGSFERWDEVVGQTVARIGRELDDRFGDPAEVIRAAHADDPRRDELGDLMTALRDEFGNKWFTASDVAARMAGGSGAGPLAEAFGYYKPPSARSVGRHLIYRRDAKVGGFCVQAAKDPHTKTMRFRVWSEVDEAGVVVDGALEQRRAALKAELGTTIRS